jgi:hypothetical protein
MLFSHDDNESGGGVGNVVYITFGAFPISLIISLFTSYLFFRVVYHSS